MAQDSEHDASHFLGVHIDRGIDGCDGGLEGACQA
jgi:hypothetical protein